LAEVELRGVSKVYPGGIQAVAGIDLAMAAGEFLVVVGPSGSGKSTLLRLIAGLETPTSGSVWIGGRRADGLAVYERDVAMVFQTPALYPYLTAFENIAFGLRGRGLAKSEIKNRVSEAAARLGLSPLLDRRPRALSGGERQRVAFGRALARRAGIVLLDEPLSNLDAPLRASTRADLAHIHRSVHSTLVMVTHDQAEALALGDRIAVLHSGRLAQVGLPKEVYHRPATRFVAEFIGSPPMNLLPCILASDADSFQVRLLGSEPPAIVSVPRSKAWAGPLLALQPGPIELGLRAEDIRVGKNCIEVSDAFTPILTARVALLEPLGHETLATLDIAPGSLVRVRLPENSTAKLNDRLPIELNLARAVWFDPHSGALLS
jgi:multiple sugar transport system ATP-binding protein